MSFFKTLFGSSNTSEVAVIRNKDVAEVLIHDLDNLRMGNFRLVSRDNIYDCLKALGKSYLTSCILVAIDKDLTQENIDTITLYPEVKGANEGEIRCLTKELENSVVELKKSDIEYQLEFHRIFNKREVMEKIGDMVTLYNVSVDRLYPVTHEGEFNFPFWMDASDRRLFDEAFRLNKDLLMKMLKGEHFVNDVLVKRNNTIKFVAKNAGLLTFLVYVGMFLMLVPMVVADNCVMDREFTEYHPYCANDTREVNYLLHSDSISSFACGNSVYANIRFGTTHMSEAEHFTAFTIGINPTGYNYLKCYQNGVESESCAKLCKVEEFLHDRTNNQNSTHANCQGDWAYCNFQTGNSSCYGVTYKYPDCSCITYKKHNTTKTYLTRNGVYCTAKDTKNNTVSANDVYNKVVLASREEEISDAYVEIQGDILYAKTKRDCNCFLEAKKDGWSSYAKFAGSEAWLKIGNEAFIKSGKLYAMIRDEDGETEDYEFDITGQVVCRVHDCIICFEAFSSFKCLPLTIKIVLILIICSLILLLLCLFPMTFIMIGKCCMSMCGGTLFCLKIPGRFYRSKLMRNCMEKAKEAKQSVLEPVDEVKVDVKPTTSGGRTNSRGYMQFLVICCCICVSTASVQDWGCTEMFDVSGTVIDCFVKTPGLRSNCSMTFETELTFNSPQQKLCRMIIDGNGKYVGRLEISLVSVETVADMKSIYYTSDYKIVDQSAHRCYDAGTCANQTCAGPQTRLASGELTLFELSQYPGETRCERRNGGWNNGCGLYTDACVFSGYAIVPRGDVYEVFEPFRIYNKPHLLVNYTTGQNHSESYRFELTNLWTEVGPFELTIEGELDNSELEFNELKVVADGKRSFLTQANDLNSYNSEIIGDIQSNSVDNLEFPGVAFGYDLTAITFVPQGKAESFYYEPAAMNHLRSDHMLPREEFGMVWSFDSNNQLRANSSDFGAIKVMMKSKSTFSFYDWTTVVCPKAISAQGSGCFDCSVGANINLTMKSICDEGLISMQIDDDDVTLLTKTLQITKGQNWYLVEILTTVESNSFYLDLIGSNTNDSILVEFTAVSIHDVVDNKTILVDTDQEEPSHSGIGGSIRHYFDKAFLGSGHWTSYLVISFVVSMVGVIIIMLVRRNRRKAVEVYEMIQSKVTKNGGSKNR